VEQGDPLDVGAFFRTSAGKPPCIHFYDRASRRRSANVFRCLLLNAIAGWMRTQPERRACAPWFYMDEIFGSFPRSRIAVERALLTLSKQGRAAASAWIGHQNR
jgi:hypothetical protein